MENMLYEKDAKWELIAKKTVAIVGYGSQGHAHALNLHDSGVKVIVALPPQSASRARAQAAGLEVMTPAEAVQKADVVMILIPDEKQAALYKEEIAPHLRAGQALAFAHGFNVHFHQIVPPADVDVFMVAPKGPGHLVRRVFEQGGGVPCLAAVYQDVSGEATELALAYARGIGGTRAGVMFTSFKDETETDLFGEQAVLCGGCSELIKAGFETLVAAGYKPELAYFECLHEMKLIVDLMYEGGMAAMRYSISDTAEYGDYSIGRRIITEETRKEMQKVLQEIQEGTFARNWILENQANRPAFLARRQQEAQHPIEEVGKRLRGQMSWLKQR